MNGRNLYGGEKGLERVPNLGIKLTMVNSTALKNQAEAKHSN
jgi:hypothetical protein